MNRPRPRSAPRTEPVPRPAPDAPAVQGSYPLLDTDLIACTGGLLDGQWFTREDWMARRAATARCETDTGIHGPALDYRPGPACPHPATGRPAQQALWTPPTHDHDDTDEDHHC